MGGARSTMAEVEEKVKGKDHLEEPEVDARIALKKMLTVRWTGLHWIYLAVGNMVLNSLVH
jgi:hypothetical protein